jgi:hypothetical protein
MLHPHGAAVWGSAQWRDVAVAWLDERLALAGIVRTGDVEQPHLRPWATVLRAPTSAGTVWMKAAGPGTAFEAGLYTILVETAPDLVLTPIATDPARGWVVLPDGGPSLGERLDERELADAIVPALVAYGRLQLGLAPRAGELLALGVEDMRPSAMPQRFEEALEATAAAADPAVHERVAAMRGTVASWCEELAASPLSPSLDHNDLHPWNILGDARSPRFYDWGDSVVAHPFAAMLVPLGFVQRALGAGLGDPGFLRARDAYLEVFAAVAPPGELAGTLGLACQVAKIARVLTWDRALRAAREQDEEIDPFFATAPADTLASLLDTSYLGGA